MDGDGENGGVPPLPQHAHLRGPDGLTVELCHGSERFCRSPDLARDADLVDLVDLVARVQKMLHPFTVVRQKQQSLGVEVEPTDGIDALAAVFDELGDGLSPFFVRERADIAARLVEHQVALLPLQRERPAVDGDLGQTSGSAFCPMDEVSPFTRTRPAAIHCSAVRREQSPASAISF